MAELAKEVGAGTFRLPKQAQDNADRADELLASFGMKETDAVPDSVTPDTVVLAAEPDEVVDQGAVAPEVEPEVESGKEPAIAPVKEAVIDDTPLTPEARILALEESLRRSEAANSTLQGKYNTELPRLKKDFDELRASVSGQIDLLAPDAPSEPETPLLEEQIAALKETYDPQMVDDFLAVMGNMSSAVVNTAVKPFAERQATEAERKLAEDRKVFNSQMSEHIDSEYNWQELFEGTNEEFNAFMASPDASGLFTYGQLVQGYSQNFDAARMAIVINKFRESQGVAPVKPATVKAPPAVAQVAPVAPTAQPKTDNIVAPNRTAPSMPAVIQADQVRIWTPESKAQFELDDREGLYTPEQSKALWDDLIVSPAQGRFRAR